MKSGYKLLAAKDCGSALVEAMLDLKGVQYDLEYLDYEKTSKKADPAYLELNPLSEVPTLLLPGGEPMTESAAIALHLEESFPGSPLLPPAGSPERPRALRWLVFLVSSVYPTFTYGDDPSEWVRAETARAEFREATEVYRKELWQIVEKAASAQGPWFLGSTFSVLDIYVCVMTHWRPRRAWFQASCPKLSRIALAADALPTLAPMISRNFGKG